MNYLKHLMVSKGTANLPMRAFMIVRRFGITGKKSGRALNRIIDITSRHGCLPTFFITADLVDRHGELLRDVSRRGIQVGLHGYHHVDHVGMPEELQREEMLVGLKKLGQLGVEVIGFRGPYLRFDENTNKAVSLSGLSWTSHSVFFFQNNLLRGYGERLANVQRLVESFYTDRCHEKQPCIPNWDLHCLEIPISLPDDEILIDRMGIKDLETITQVWLQMLELSRSQGELFNLVLHPERIDFFAKPLDALLSKAISYKDVWISSLNEIAEWWDERARFSYEIVEDTGSCYQITFHFPARGVIVLHHDQGRTESLNVVPGETVPIYSLRRPVICALPGFCDRDIAYLANEGFLIENHADPARCAIVLEGKCSTDRRELVDKLNRTGYSLIRLRRWPKGFESALAVTTDVDAVTLTDFLHRVGHFSGFHRTTDAHR